MLWGYVILLVFCSLIVASNYNSCFKKKLILYEFPFWKDTDMPKKWFWGWFVAIYFSIIIYTICIIIWTPQNYIYTTLRVSLYYFLLLFITRLCIANYIKKKHDK